LFEEGLRRLLLPLSLPHYSLAAAQQRRRPSSSFSFFVALQLKTAWDVKYARQLKMAWDVKYWDQESNKTSRTKQLVDVLDFHESRMIHGR
jgi:hypothetical protein